MSSSANPNSTRPGQPQESFAATNAADNPQQVPKYTPERFRHAMMHMDRVALRYGIVLPRPAIGWGKPRDPVASSAWQAVMVERRRLWEPIRTLMAIQREQLSGLAPRPAPSASSTADGAAKSSELSSAMAKGGQPPVSTSIKAQGRQPQTNAGSSRSNVATTSKEGQPSPSTTTAAAATSTTTNGGQLQDNAPTVVEEGQPQANTCPSRSNAATTSTEGLPHPNTSTTVRGGQLQASACPSTAAEGGQTPGTTTAATAAFTTANGVKLEVNTSITTDEGQLQANTGHFEPHPQPRPGLAASRPAGKPDDDDDAPPAPKRRRYSY
ncbi:hypothetical protein BC567DRAFT_263501 [Phyllosticta citribraziliensis]